MDSYFQRVHRLPQELVRVIYEYATLRNEIRAVTLRSPPLRPLTRPYNIIFFTSWQYINDQMDGTGQYVVYDTENRIRTMYITL